VSTLYTIEFRSPHYIEQGVSTTMEAPMYNGASLVAPSSGTVTVYDGSGSEVVSAGTVIITNDIATYQFAAADTTSLDVSMDWWVVWDLVKGLDNIEEDFHIVSRNQAALCKYILRPTVSNQTILTREPTFTGYPRGETSWQKQISDVYHDTLTRLIEEGREPHRITSPYSLHAYQRAKVLEIVAELQASLAVGGADRWTTKAEMYREMAEAAWLSVRFEYDTDDDGDSDAEGQAIPGVLYTSRPPTWGDV